MVAVLSDGAWRQHFGADAGIVGRHVRLQGRAFTIVGVMPAAFHDAALAYTDRVDVWAPLEALCCWSALPPALPAGRAARVDPAQTLRSE